MRSRAVLSVFALAALVVLLGLGTWQLQRLAWKTELQAKIDARLKEAPKSLFEVWLAHKTFHNVEYSPVLFRGVFDHNRAVRVYALNKGKAGWHIYTPLQDDESQKTFVFINRGFVPELFHGESIDVSKPRGVVTIRGLVRHWPSKPSVFTPQSEPNVRAFYWRDFVAIEASARTERGVSILPFYIDEVPSPTVPANDWPRPGTTRLKLSNRHLEYAITWYGLALALAGVYGFLMFGGGRSRAGGDNDT